MRLYLSHPLYTEAYMSYLNGLECRIDIKFLNRKTGGNPLTSLIPFRYMQKRVPNVQVRLRKGSANSLNTAYITRSSILHTLSSQSSTELFIFHVDEGDLKNCEFDIQLPRNVEAFLYIYKEVFRATDSCKWKIFGTNLHFRFELNFCKID